jgi:hypothetical protein
MPGVGDAKDAPPSYGDVYLHQFRVSNAYSFLNDLSKVPGAEGTDGEEE